MGNKLPTLQIHPKPLTVGCVTCYAPSKVSERQHDAGVPLLLGSDAFGALVPGFAPHQELELMVAAGLSPYEALRTGTLQLALDRWAEMIRIRPSL